MKLTMTRLTVLAASLLVAGVCHAQSASYQFSTLASVGNDYSAAYAINDLGQVAGISHNAANQTRATLWNSGVATDLGTFGGNSSYALAINNAGVVAGSSAAVGVIRHATVWGSGGSATDLGTMGADRSVVFGINDAGVMVGDTRNNAQDHMRAALWSNGSSTDLGTLGGSNSSAYAINMAGVAVGTSSTSGDAASHAVIWQNGVISDMGAGAGVYDNSDATAINASGTIVGDVFNADNSLSHAAVWHNGVLLDLGAPDGEVSYGGAINNAGLVVGGITQGAGIHATLWNGSTAVDLNKYLDPSAVAAGWTLAFASGINSDGSIVGYATNDQLNVTRGFVLTAVPEPETYAMLLAGLCLVGGLTRRRAAQRAA